MAIPYSKEYLNKELKKQHELGENENPGLSMKDAFSLFRSKFSEFDIDIYDGHTIIDGKISTTRICVSNKSYPYQGSKNFSISIEDFDGAHALAYIMFLLI